MAENRTSEFLAMARSLPRDGGLPPQFLSVPPPSSTDRTNTNTTSIAKLRDFHNTAGGISRDIASTSRMLADLTQLVRQKSLFQDDSQKVNELVVRIKSTIENLNSRLDDAGRQIAQQKRALGKNSQPAQEASNVVGQLQEEFGQTAAGFKSILQQRTDAMKEATDRKKDIYGTDTVEDIPILNLENRPPVYSTSDDNNGGFMAPGGFPTLDLTSGMMPAGEPTGSSLPRPRKWNLWFLPVVQSFIFVVEMAFFENCNYLIPNSHSFSSLAPLTDGITPMSSRTGSGSIPNYASSGASNYYGNSQSQNPGAAMLSPFDIQKMEQESGQDQMMQLIPDQDYLRDRADAMEQVESNIVELGAVYNRLATMVHEHKDMVQRVEDNVDEANSMVTMGMNQLVDTLANLRTNRGLALKVFSILVVFIISFIVFFA